MFEWKNKVCIVTGGCSGIGLAFVQSILAKDGKCLVADLNFKTGEKLQTEYGMEKLIYVRTDITSHQSFEEAFEKCLEHFGTIDILVNSAGINGENNWETQLQINLLVSN